MKQERSTVSRRNGGTNMMPAMMPAYGHKRQRRVDGNVTQIETEFASRVRFLVIWEAQREAKQAVIRELKGEGRRVSLMSAAELNRLAVAHLRANAAVLLAQAEASGIVQSLAAESVRKDSRNRTLALEAQRNQKEIQQ
jgi:hypothetical protein